MRGMAVPRAGTIVLLLALIVPSAQAAQTHALELQASIEQLVMEDEGTIQANEGLYRFQAPTQGETQAAEPIPWLSIDAGAIIVRQYWVNGTTVQEPLGGGNAYTFEDRPEVVQIDIQPTELTLLSRTDDPDLRMYVRDPNGAVANVGAGSTMQAPPAINPFGTTRAFLHTVDWNDPELDRFHTIPEDSLWFSLRPTLWDIGEEMVLLIDGWNVRLGNEHEAMDFQTGSRTEQGTPLREGGMARDIYTFLVVTILDGTVEVDAESGAWQGYAPAPRMTWTGNAALDVYHGQLRADAATVTLSQNRLRLGGDFQGDAQFTDGPGLDGAQVRATGNGITNAALPFDEAGPFATASRAGLWGASLIGLAVVGALVGQTTRSVRHRDHGQVKKRPEDVPVATAPTPAETKQAAPGANPPADAATLNVEELVERVQRHPLDSDAQFHLGVRLIQAGQASMAVRHLERSFRIDQNGILRLLENPDYRDALAHPDVRDLLARIQREQQRRVWAGYA